MIRLLSRLASTVLGVVVTRAAVYVESSMPVESVPADPQELRDYHRAACVAAESNAESRRAMQGLDFADWEQEVAS